MPPITPDQIKPALTDVASHIASRTVDEYGNKHDTFNDGTTPSAAQAEEHALRAARYVAGRLARVPEALLPDLLASARDVAALRAALTIEASYYASGSDPSSAGVDQLGRLFREELDALEGGVNGLRPGGRQIRSYRARTTLEQPPGGVFGP